MSHCTKFDFSYTDEDAIVKAFYKLGIKCSKDLALSFKSDKVKHFFGRLGYMGDKQYKSIVGEIDSNTEIFVIKTGDAKYELVVEHKMLDGVDVEEDEKIARSFRNAYIEVAIDKVIRKLDLNAIPCEMQKMPNGVLLSFGQNYEYQLSVLSIDGQVIEDVKGVKGDLCTKLTEDIEEILSQPTSELKTEWKPEVNMPIVDEVLQVLSLNF